MRKILVGMRQCLRSSKLSTVNSRQFSSFLNFKRVTPDQILHFFKENNIEYKIRSGGQIVAKYCPLCPKPHKNEVTNMWTLNVKSSDGAFYCFRCGEHGGWSTLVSKLIGEEITTFSSTRADNDSAEETVSPEEVHNFYVDKRINFQKAAKYVEQMLLRKDGKFESNALLDISPPRQAHIKIIEYLTNPKTGRGLSLEILKKFDIGIGEEMFRNSSGNLELVPVIYFPMYQRGKVKAHEEPKLAKTKIRGMGPEFKKYQRVFPSGSKFALFGLQTFPKNAPPETVVITEGEFDAMAVHQATGLPVLSLPYGASNLPREMLAYLADAKRVYLWMDFDEVGQMNVEVFAEKIGQNRTFIVKDMKASSVIDFLKASPDFNAKTNQVSEKSTSTNEPTINQSQTAPSDSDSNQINVQSSPDQPTTDQNNPQNNEESFSTAYSNEELFLNIELENIKIKDANDALRISPYLVQAYIKKSRPFPQENIVLFSHLREIVRERIFHQERFQGVKSGYFRWFNAIVKGFRRGE